MAKLESSTGKAKCQVSPDGISIIFEDTNSHQIFWPASDWQDLKQYLEAKIYPAQKKASSNA